MIVIERTAGELVRIGSYTLKVLEVNPDGVVMALLGPEEDPSAPLDAPAADRRVTVGPSSSVSAPPP